MKFIPVTFGHQKAKNPLTFEGDKNITIIRDDYPNLREKASPVAGLKIGIPDDERERLGLQEGDVFLRIPREFLQ